ncbi:MAG: hypothetical protein IJH94_00055 [Clostridia bacterium]|nr:hypothetical protein [Clostridia bacterium]
MADRIVYGQNDLLKALGDGIKNITLCAGIYEIPLCSGIMFDRLGPVKVKVNATRRAAEDAGMQFRDIYPEYESGYALDERVPLWSAAGSGGSFGSGGSYSGSGGSYLGSGGSYALFSSLGSFFGSYGSFAFRSSFHGSYGSSAFRSPFNGSADAVFVLGYGIDLI